MKTPSTAQVNECVEQMIKKQTLTHNERVQGWAQLRLADFSAVLAEWAIDQSHISPQWAALPQVANALKQPNLPSETAAKLTQFIQHHAAQGQQTAQLYWAYCLAMGKYTTQNPRQAAQIARQLQTKNDWRGTRFLGEMLAAAPLAAADLLHDEIETAAQNAHRQNPDTPLTQWLQHGLAFAQNSNAIKYAARVQLETATQQGSPTAAQRLRGLTALGLTAAALPANRYRSIQNWLTAQAQNAQYQAMPTDASQADSDILVLPDNIPLLPQAEQEQHEIWQRVATIGGVILVFALLMTILMQMMAK